MIQGNPFFDTYLRITDFVCLLSSCLIVQTRTRCSIFLIIFKLNTRMAGFNGCGYRHERLIQCRMFNLTGQSFSHINVAAQVQWSSIHSRVKWSRRVGNWTVLSISASCTYNLMPCLHDGSRDNRSKRSIIGLAHWIRGFLRNAPERTHCWVCALEPCTVYSPCRRQG